MSTETENDKLEKIYEKLIKKFGIDKIAFKRHPRDERELVSARKYIYGSVPFELFGCIQDLSSNILVAWDSTAVLTPKMFFGQEPTVILLYRIVKGKINNYSETEKLYSMFSECYESKTKFIVPQTLEELQYIIDKL